MSLVFFFIDSLYEHKRILVLDIWTGRIYTKITVRMNDTSYNV